MKSINHFFLVLSCLLLISNLAQVASGQERAPSPDPPTGEVESLRRLIEEQRLRIQQLQSDSLQQSRALEEQKQLIEVLRLKLEQLLASVATDKNGKLPTTATVQVTDGEVNSKEPAEKPQPVQASQKNNDKPGSVENGYGKIKFNGLLQAWAASGDEGFRDTFRIRRVELKFVGEITPQVKWTVMIEPSRGLGLVNTLTTIDGIPVLSDTRVNQGSRILQDAFITLNYFERMKFDFGQVKLPLSLEGMQSSSRLDTVERALFLSDGGRGGSLGDVRDIGAMIYGPLNSSVDYYVGFFNGSNESQNDVDRNEQKVLIGRLVVRPPFLKGLQVGASGAWGGNGERPDRPRRNRLGGEMLFTHKAVKLKGELMTAKDGSLSRLGYYGHFGYLFHPKWEGIFRYDVFDPNTRLDTNAANVTERDYIAGLNYYITENHVKLQFNYLRKTFADKIVDSRNLVLVNLQTSW